MALTIDPSLRAAAPIRLDADGARTSRVELAPDDAGEVDVRALYTIADTRALARLIDESD
jgi:hypothetical protein